MLFPQVNTSGYYATAHSFGSGTIRGPQKRSLNNDFHVSFWLHREKARATVNNVFRKNDVSTTGFYHYGQECEAILRNEIRRLCIPRGKTGPCNR
jgi:hypothetical protein